MGQKAITIYTPSGSTAHIAAEDDAFIYRTLLGGTSGILGSLTCVRVDDNTVRLSGGGVSNRGYILWIPDGTTLELTVDSGSAGQNRVDVVAAEFVRGGGETADTHAIKVIKGTAVSGTPSAPVMATSSLLSAGNVNRVALFAVTVTGTEITGITRIGQKLPTASDSMPGIYVQQAQPSSPSVGDLWLW